MIRYIAHHETAHAVTALAIGYRVERVTLDPPKATILGPLPGTDCERVKRRLLIVLAGPLAEAIMRGETSFSWQADTRERDLIDAMIACQFIAERYGQYPQEVLDRTTTHLHKLLLPIWPGIVAAAAELQRVGQIDGRRVAAHCAVAMGPLPPGKSHRLRAELAGDVHLSVEWLLGDCRE